MIDKEANKAIRIRHYKNYEALLLASKFKNNAEIARRTGICPSAFSDWSQGRSEPKLDKIQSLAKLFRVGLSKIID